MLPATARLLVALFAMSRTCTPMFFLPPIFITSRLDAHITCKFISISKILCEITYMQQVMLELILSRIVLVQC